MNVSRTGTLRSEFEECFTLSSSKIIFSSTFHNLEFQTLDVDDVSHCDFKSDSSMMISHLGFVRANQQTKLSSTQEQSLQSDRSALPN